MSKFLALGVILAGFVAFSGCVSKGKYMEVVEETEGVRAELEKTQAKKNLLEQQVKSLKESNGKLAADADLATAEMQRLKESQEREKESIEARIQEQEQKIRDLASQQKAMRMEYEEAKQRNEALKATTARYQKELKERQQAMESSIPPSPRPPIGGPPPTQLAPKPPGSPAKVQPDVAPVPSAPKSGLAPVNINTASANDMVLFLGLTKDMAERVVANRPYRLKGELVAKNVVPKGTFDVIKDRISVTP
jgi:DNA uptake protein ComE-like DNA-binding protein